MRKKIYKQTLLDIDSYTLLNNAKKLMSEAAGGRKIRFSDVITDIVGRRVRYLSLDKDIRRYIEEITSLAAKDTGILGVLLFGSVSRGTYNQHSDIDLLFVVDGDQLGFFYKIENIIRAAEPYRKILTDRGFSMHATQLVVMKEDLNYFRPLYINLFEDGVIIYERNSTLSDFLADIRKSVDFKKEIVNNNVVLTWKIRK
jgi:predicted nucleotidyltransferase